MKTKSNMTDNREIKIKYELPMFKDLLGLIYQEKFTKGLMGLMFQKEKQKIDLKPEIS